MDTKLTDGKNVAYLCDDGAVRILTHNYKSIYIDAKDWDLVKGYRWCVNKRGNTEYAFAGKPKFKGLLLMHRLIMATEIAAAEAAEAIMAAELGVKPRMLVVDHKNGFGEDNRQGNLQVITNRANTSKQRRVGGMTSKYPGVYWHKAARKWLVQIWHGAERVNLKLHDTATDAAAAYESYKAQHNL